MAIALGQNQNGLVHLSSLTQYLLNLYFTSYPHLSNFINFRFPINLHQIWFFTAYDYFERNKNWFKFWNKELPFGKQIDIQHAKIDEQNIHGKQITCSLLVKASFSCIHFQSERKYSFSYAKNYTILVFVNDCCIKSSFYVLIFELLVMIFQLSSINYLSIKTYIS